MRTPKGYSYSTNEGPGIFKDCTNSTEDILVLIKKYEVFTSPDHKSVATHKVKH